MAYDKEYGNIVGRMEDLLELTCPDCGITYLWKAYGRPDYCKEINCKKCGKVLAHQYGTVWELLSISIGGKMFVPNKDGCFTVELGEEADGKEKLNVYLLCVKDWDTGTFCEVAVANTEGEARKISNFDESDEPEIVEVSLIEKGVYDPRTYGENIKYEKK